MPLVSGSPYNSQHQGAYGVGIGIQHTLATNRTTTGLTDWADLVGYVSRAYLLIVNGPTNPVNVRVKTHFDPNPGSPFAALPWLDVDYRFSADDPYTTGVTAIAVAGGAHSIVFLPSVERARYIACDITTANANGSSIYLFAER